MPSTADRPITVIDLLDRGPVPYERGHELQRRLLAERAGGERDDALVLLEHEAVVTVGRGARRDGTGPDGLPAVLDGGRFPVVEVERGGEATWHGPGQLVGYPIIALGEGERDLHRHLRRIEDALIAALGDLGVSGAGRRAGATGVWIDGARKVASIGIAVQRWVTWHGFALNVRPDLSAFAAIRPCGFGAEVMTSVAAERGDDGPSVREAADAVVRRLAEAFGRVVSSSGVGRGAGEEVDV